MRWAGHVAPNEAREGVYMILMGKPERFTPLKETGVDGKIIFGWIFRKWDMGLWTRSSWLRVRTGGGHL